MEFYSAVRKDEVMNISGKWLELESVILNEVTQTQKGNQGTNVHLQFIKPVPYMWGYILMDHQEPGKWKG